MKNYLVEDVIEEESELFTDYGDSSKKRSLIISKILKSSEKKENLGSILMNCNFNTTQNLNNAYFQGISDSLRNSLNTIKSFNLNNSSSKKNKDKPERTSQESEKNDKNKINRHNSNRSEIPKISVIDFSKHYCNETPEFRQEKTTYKQTKQNHKVSRSMVPDINNGLASVVNEIVLKLKEKSKNSSNHIKTKKKQLLDSFLKCKL